MNINRQIIFTALLLIVTIYFFGTTEFDISLQDYFYNFNTHSWILPNNTVYKTILYTAIKNVLIIFAVSMLFCLIGCWKKEWMKSYKKGFVIVILAAIFVPATANLLKKETNMPCPKNEIHYGGLYPRTAVWQSYDLEYQKKPRIRCWPAGHASGGFALMSLFFLFRKRKNRYLALFGGVAIGWLMGGYKMLIGDHFLSHTVITMVLAWLIILIIARFVIGKEIEV